jgi:hypothetical protein
MPIANNVDEIQKTEFATVQTRRKELAAFVKEYEAKLKELEERTVIRGDVVANEIPDTPVISYPV